MENQSKNLVLSMLAYAAQREIPVDDLARMSKIDIEKLRLGSESPTQKQMDDLWLNAVFLSKDKLFGLHFGKALQLAALGVVGQIVKSSNTVGEAMMIAATLAPALTNLFKIEVHKTKDRVAVDFIPQDRGWKKSVAACQTLDLLMVFVVHEMDGLVLKKIKPTRISYSGVISDVNEYERVLRCRPDDNSEFNRLTFDASFWDEPVITANYELQRLLIEKNDKLNRLVNNKASLQTRIYNYLLSNSYLGIASLDEIAQNFSMSSRTLQRKLKDEGINFQKLADEVRKSLALEYLKSGNYPLKEISYMLGYNESSAFTRTFKRWTGTAPAAYRQSGLND